MLDSIYYMTLRLLWNLNAGSKNLSLFTSTQHCYVNSKRYQNLQATCGLSILMHGSYIAARTKKDLSFNIISSWAMAQVSNPGPQDPLVHVSMMKLAVFKTTIMLLTIFVVLFQNNSENLD